MLTITLIIKAKELQKKTKINYTNADSKLDKEIDGSITEIYHLNL